MILHITHTDLDGAGCAIIVKKVFKNVKTVYLNYDEVDSYLLENFKDYEKIIITDVSTKEEIFTTISKEKDTLLIDHHKTTLNFAKFDNVIHSLNKSATLLSFEYFSETAQEIEAYRDLAEVINDYDLWIHKDERSSQLNKLFYLYSIENFVERFLKKPIVKFDEKEQFALEMENRNEEEYLKNAEQYVSIDTDFNGRKFGYIFAEKYNSEIGHHLITKFDLDYVIIINMQTKKVSLRSKKDVDVSILAKNNGGGGHKNAAGFSTDFAFCIDKFLKNIGVK